MAQNKGAIVRYRAIDKCLRSKHGRYGWEELAQACSDALYDAFSERMTVSRRQIFLDLNHMEACHYILSINIDTFFGGTLTTF